RRIPSGTPTKKSFLNKGTHSEAANAVGIRRQAGRGADGRRAVDRLGRVVGAGRAAATGEGATPPLWIPLAWTLTGGNRHDGTLTADRAYDYDSHRRQLRQRGIAPEIARRQTEHGSGLGRYRWVVERTFAWLHQFKRLLVRYDRRADIHEAFLALGCCLVCYRRLKNTSL